MAQKVGNEKNILVGASPLFLSVDDSTTPGYDNSMEAGLANSGTAATGTGAAKVAPSTLVPVFASGVSYTDTLNAATPNKEGGVTAAAYRNVGYTNNGLQISYQPTYDSVTVDQLLDTAKLFKSAMQVQISTEMAEGTLENILAVFGQKSSTLTEKKGGTPEAVLTGLAAEDHLGLEAGALGSAPTERQLIAVGQAPTSEATAAERVYYARRVLSVEQSQFSLARTAATTFPVTFRLLPSGELDHIGSEYGKIIDRVLKV
jgi:hypothetical protein